MLHLKALFSPITDTVIRVRHNNYNETQATTVNITPSLSNIITAPNMGSLWTTGLPHGNNATS